MVADKDSLEAILKVLEYRPPPPTDDVADFGLIRKRIQELGQRKTPAFAVNWSAEKGTSYEIVIILPTGFYFKSLGCW